MHATLSRRSVHPDPVQALLVSAGRRRALDRNVLPVALSAAVLVHLVLFTLPLPEPPPPSVAPGPPPDTSALTPTPLPPPEIRPLAAAPRPVERLLPVPFEERIEIEAVDAPRPDPPPPTVTGGYAVLLPDAVPPPAPLVYPEGTAGLVLPVPWPGRARPDYPEPARIVGIRGRVVLQAVIDESGRVASIEVLAVSRPDLGFSEAAIEAVSGWRYEPGRLGERPVPVRMRVLIEFSLE